MISSWHLRILFPLFLPWMSGINYTGAIEGADLSVSVNIGKAYIWIPDVLFVAIWYNMIISVDYNMYKCMCVHHSNCVCSYQWPKHIQICRIKITIAIISIFGIKIMEIISQEQKWVYVLSLLFISHLNILEWKGVITTRVNNVDDLLFSCHKVYFS